MSFVIWCSWLEQKYWLVSKTIKFSIVNNEIWKSNRCVSAVVLLTAQHTCYFCFKWKAFLPFTANPRPCRVSGSEVFGIGGRTAGVRKVSDLMWHEEIGRDIITTIMKLTDWSSYRTMCDLVSREQLTAHQVKVHPRLKHLQRLENLMH